MRRAHEPGLRRANYALYSIRGFYDDVLDIWAQEMNPGTPFHPTSIGSAMPAIGRFPDAEEQFKAHWRDPRDDLASFLPRSVHAQRDGKER